MANYEGPSLTIGRALFEKGDRVYVGTQRAVVVEAEGYTLTTRPYRWYDWVMDKTWALRAWAWKQWRRGVRLVRRRVHREEGA